MKINLGNVVDAYAAFKGDNVTFKVGKCEIYTSKGVQPKLMLRVNFVCVDSGDAKGKQVQESYMLEGDLSYFKRFLLALGFSATEEIDIDEIAEPDRQLLSGRELIADVDIVSQKTINPRTNKPYPPKSQIVRYYVPGENEDQFNMS